MTRADAGSFRDPDSRVHIQDGRVLRTLSERGRSNYEAFAATALATDGRIVRTWRVGEDTLEHERIPFVTYPYEWTFGMLKAAALLQLDLLEAALGEKLSLKDASPYNVQFRGPEPVFIDVGSFEPLRPDEPWIGYRQFCTLFLYPLMLTAYRGVGFQPWLKGSLEGIEPADAAALLPRRKGVTINARLLARLERRQDDTSARETTSRLAKAGYRPELIVAQVRRLRRLVDGLEWQVPETAWTAYERDPEHAAAKAAFVSEVAERIRPALAWDLGCNDGTFSRLLAPHAQTVIAMDADHATVESLFRGLDVPNITPLVVDLTDPSPARGWALRERAPLEERGRPELTLSLALIHHLAITRTVPVPMILEWLKGLGGTHVVEFPHRDDPMVQRLLAAKRDGWAYDRDAFETAARATFEIRRRREIGTRTLYELA